MTPSLTGLLIFVARQFSADPSGLLAECHGALKRQEALRRRVWIPPETVPALSPGAMRFLASIEHALLYCVNSQVPASAPSASPGILEEPLGRVGAGPGVPASSHEDVITLKEAAQLLGFRAAISLTVIPLVGPPTSQSATAPLGSPRHPLLLHLARICLHATHRSKLSA